MPAFELAHDQLAVAINVCADLQHRCLAIASSQRRQIGFRHDHRNLDRGPGQALEPETEPDFLRIGRGFVVVQDDIGHGKVLGGDDAFPLERDDFSSNRHLALAYWWSMIFSENRYPLFGIML